MNHHPWLVESYCVPDFDSPSIFARILDKDKVCMRAYLQCADPLSLANTRADISL